MGELTPDFSVLARMFKTPPNKAQLNIFHRMLNLNLKPPIDLIRKAPK